MNELMELLSEINTLPTIERVILFAWLVCIVVFVITYTYTCILITKQKLFTKKPKPQTF